MNTATLFSKFSQGVNWNGIFYSIHKTFTTLLSFMLFTALTTQGFSTWANINSIVFLLLLWVDCGMRKSIPRYVPEFAKNRVSHERFIKTILIFQTSVLIITTPLVLYLINKLPYALGLHDHYVYFYIGGGIFITEGIVSILRLIYHAHFWNKQFNIITIIALAIEMIANIGILLYYTQSASILKGIFATKFISGMIVNISALCMLSRLYKDKNYPDTTTINYHEKLTAFAKHSGMMWANTNIKSITERNFLVPLFTYVFGAAIANLFKIANDGALFFHRTALKTIGTTDTALLSHAQTASDKQTLMPIAFARLASKIINLCIPLATLLLILFLNKDHLFSNSFALQAFFIMTIGYLIELLISPYERMLEIEQRYILLLLSYAPYILMIASFVYWSLFIQSIGLVACVFIIHVVRLMSAFVMVYFARTRYTYIKFPSQYLAKVIGICIPFGIVLYFILIHFSFIVPYIGALIKSK